MSILLVASVVLSLLMIDSAFMQVGAPYIVRGLSLTSLEFTWALNISFVSTALFLVISGNLSRGLGLRNVFILGLVAYSLSLCMCGLSSSLAGFLLGRFFQGFAVALLAPTGLTVLVRGFEDKMRGRAVGFTAALSSFFFTFSPIIAGFICQWSSWRGLFAVPFILVSIGFVLAVRSIPKENKRALLVDFKAYFLYCISFILGIITSLQGFHWGWSSLKTITCGLCTTIFLLLFIYLHLKKKISIIDFSLFKYGSFRIANCLVFLVQCIFVHIFFWSIFFYRYLGFEPLQIAELTMVATFPLLLFSYISGWIVDNKSAYASIILGLVIFLVSTLFFYLFALYIWLPYLIIGLAFFGIGLSLVSTPLSVLVVQDIPKEKQGEACGVYQTIRFYGSVLGVVLLSIVNTSLEKNSINSWWSQFFPNSVVENLTLFTFSIDNFLIIFVATLALFLTILSLKPYKDNKSLPR